MNNMGSNKNISITIYMAVTLMHDMASIKKNLLHIIKLLH